MIPDHSGYIGAPSQSSSPSSHDIPQSKVPHRTAGASPAKAQSPMQQSRPPAKHFSIKLCTFQLSSASSPAMPSLLAHANFLLGFATSPSYLTHASCNCVGPPRPCTFPFMLLKSSHLTRASCNYVRPARPCTFPFTLRKFAESPHSCFLQLCWACSSVHISFYASQVRQVTSLVLLAIVPGLLTRAHFLLRFASSSSHLTRASCNCAGPAHLCKLSFMLRKFTESPHSCFLQLCRAYSPVHTFFYASQIRRVCSLVLLATVPGLIARAHFLLRFASSPRLLIGASCNYARLARPCTLSS
ncbi:hypothetical protein CRG98_012159 [Punica granatum]|uniref:Uncharacterized protein n=1 Tax=Punica granatum TaxID=22663 RepID=A0A2I0KGF7_PUNGR|nr:hypothetical protein CRG98_012159 [Punica granatum]